VRIQAPDDDDVLEPLPVYVDGIAIAPVRASASYTAPSMHAPMILDPTPAIAGPLAVRTPQPWAPAEHRSAPPMHHATSVAVFSRMIPLRAVMLDFLPVWWRLRERNERVEIADRLFLEPPRRGGADTWRMPGSLHSPWHPRSTPFELLLWSRLDTWTKLSLQPQCGVRVGRRYFTSGHEVLDELCTELIHGLTPDALTHADELLRNTRADGHSQPVGRSVAAVTAHR
jgi:hypothetical protein